jgi:hypothetical protein
MLYDTIYCIEYSYLVLNTIYCLPDQTLFYVRYKLIFTIEKTIGRYRTVINCLTE